MTATAPVRPRVEPPPKNNEFSSAFSSAFDPSDKDPDQTDPARDAAVASVRAYCGWHVAPRRTETITLDGPGTGTLVLPSLRVVEILQVEEDGVLLDAESFSWSHAGMVRRAPGWVPSAQPRWTPNLRGLRVVLTHGYDEWPAEVAGVIDRLVARSGIVGAVAQVGQVRYATGADGLPASSTLSTVDQAALAPYRLPFRP